MFSFLFGIYCEPFDTRPVPDFDRGSDFDVSFVAVIRGSRLTLRARSGTGVERFINAHLNYSPIIFYRDK